MQFGFRHITRVMPVGAVHDSSSTGFDWMLLSPLAFAAM
jgi:hypothetical protein